MLMLKIDTTPTLFSIEKAEKVAAEFAAGDPEWTYVVANPAGPLSAVEIFDEDGESVGFA